MKNKSSKQPNVAGRETWLEARRALLEREKALTRQYDAVCRARRALPWVRVDAPYTFETPGGDKTMADLFNGRSQLLVYHFMFGPDWETGCKSCSFWADHFDAVRPHLAARDIELIAVSRGPLARLRAFAKRLGWRFPWASSGGSSFNEDFGVSFPDATVQAKEQVYNYGTQAPHGSETQGLSAFVKNENGEVFHTYSTYGRGVETVNAAYRFMDLAPLGRNEDDLPWGMAWLKLHDEY